MNKIFLVARSEKSFVNFRLDWVRFMISRGSKFTITFESLSDSLLTELRLLGVDCFVFSNQDIGRFALFSEFRYFFWVFRKMRLSNLSETIVLVYFLRSAFWFSFFSQFLKVNKIIFLIEGLGSIGSLYESTLFRRIFLFVISFVAMRADTVCCLNRRDADIFRSACHLVRIRMLPGIGFDGDRFRFAARTRVKRVLFAGRLLDEKGFLDYLKIVDLYADSTFKFYAAGSAETISKRSRELFLSLVASGRLNFLGYRTDIENVLSECDLFLFPSVYNEGAPRILMEAMASGALIFSTKFNSHELFLESCNDFSDFALQFSDDLDFVDAFQKFVENTLPFLDIEKLSAANADASHFFNSDRIFPLLEDIIYE